MRRSTRVEDGDARGVLIHHHRRCLHDDVCLSRANARVVSVLASRSSSSDARDLTHRTRASHSFISRVDFLDRDERGAREGRARVGRTDGV